MTAPLVSVIVPVLNAVNFLDECFASGMDECSTSAEQERANRYECVSLSADVPPNWLARGVNLR
jgi:hypothetical protein